MTTGKGTTTSIEKIFAEIPKHFTLSQNYPNPFNPSTNIDYQIPQRAYITIKVYNEMGQEVAILKDREQAAGSFCSIRRKKFSEWCVFCAVAITRRIIGKKVSANEVIIERDCKNKKKMRHLRFNIDLSIVLIFLKNFCVN